MLGFHTFFSGCGGQTSPMAGRVPSPARSLERSGHGAGGLCRVPRVLSICLSLHPTLPCLLLVSLNTEHASSRRLVTPVFQLSHMAFPWI